MRTVDGPRREWRRDGFTLLEVLLSIALIAVLAALMIPSITAARDATLRAKTRAQFSQWMLACVEFRQEYGFLPTLGRQGRIATAADTLAFVAQLTGRNPDGTPVSDAGSLGGNTRRLSFVDLSSDAIDDDGLLADAFGNTEIGVLVDADGDGWIKPGIDGALGSLILPTTGQTVSPPSSVLPAGGVRGTVIFYTVGAGRTSDDIVTSWN